MRRSIATGVLILGTIAAHPSAAQTLPATRILTHREQAPLQHHWIEERLTTLLPALMRREGIDMWVIVSREYNDDPVFRSMAPLTTYLIKELGIGNQELGIRNWESGMIRNEA